MTRRVITFRYPHKNSIGIDAMLVIAAIASAVAIFFLLFVIVKFSGWIQPRPEYVSGPFRGVALEDVLYDPGEETMSDADIIYEKRSSTSAYKGQMDVSFLVFHIEANESGKVNQMILTVSGPGDSSNVTALQLYLNDDFFTEKPVYQGQARFDNLNITVDARENTKFEFKGKVSNGATSSDRIRVGIAGGEDVVIRNAAAEVMSMGGNLPLWGRYVSVIGSRF